MCKKLLLLPVIALLLAGCGSLPSPQDTQPTQESKCAAIRAKMAQVGSNNNNPSAVSDSQNIDYRTIYHEECE
ncbi:MAG: hypothetical protein V4496_03265 [Pseudomonadota bacterium]